MNVMMLHHPFILLKVFIPILVHLFNLMLLLEEQLLALVILLSIYLKQLVVWLA